MGCLALLLGAHSRVVLIGLDHVISRTGELTAVELLSFRLTKFVTTEVVNILPSKH